MRGQIKNRSVPYFLDTLSCRSNYKALLKDALTKIKNLEEEMAHFRQNSNNNFLCNKSHSKSDICRHWLRNQCTWQAEVSVQPWRWRKFYLVAININ